MEKRHGGWEQALVSRRPQFELRGRLSSRKGNRREGARSKHVQIGMLKGTRTRGNLRPQPRPPTQPSRSLSFLTCDNGSDHDRAGELFHNVRTQRLINSHPTVDGTRGDYSRYASRALIPESMLNLSRVVVHPLVLLSVTDHHARSVPRGSNKRVIGILLGQDNGKTINVANSFGIPFEEDERDPKTWFLDHNYIEGMWEMFKKVNGG